MAKKSKAKIWKRTEVGVYSLYGSGYYATSSFEVAIPINHPWFIGICRRQQSRHFYYEKITSKRATVYRFNGKLICPSSYVLSSISSYTGIDLDGWIYEKAKRLFEKIKKRYRYAVLSRTAHGYHIKINRYIVPVKRHFFVRKKYKDDPVRLKLDKMRAEAKAIFNRLWDTKIKILKKMDHVVYADKFVVVSVKKSDIKGVRLVSVKFRGPKTEKKRW